MDYTHTLTKGICTLKPVGRITFADSQQFKNFANETLDSDIKKLVIDFSEVDFVDSAALGILLLMQDKTKQNAISLILKSPVGQVKKMFDISRFNDLFTIEA